MKKVKERKVKNPLLRRIPREFIGDWRKYLVVSLFLMLVIGFISGMYVANESMMTAAKEGAEKYQLEDGHFELEQKAGSALLSAIASGEKADVKVYYTDKARAELDEKFEDTFAQEFTKKFDAEFAETFDSSFRVQIQNSLTAQGISESAASAMLTAAVEQAKQNGQYKAAYDSAYSEAYLTAYAEAYQKAYDEAWSDILAEIDEQYEDAQEKYKLNDPDFQPVPVKLYENFYRSETEDNNCDGEADGSVRVFAKTEAINLACLLDGCFPETEDEIAIDRMHAENVGVSVGDEIVVGSVRFHIVGLIAYVNYSTLHEKNTDMMFDALKFDVAMVTKAGFDRLDSAVHYNYAWEYENKTATEIEEKKLADDFLPALLTQTIVAENALEDYLPAYANQAIHFAPNDMGSDLAMGGVLLDILMVIIAFIFAVTISNTMVRESKVIGTLRSSGYTKGELVCHYMTMPIIVTLLSAAVGNLLGYIVFKYVVISMYYNSYSLPAYETIWNPDAFVKTTIIPLIVMFIVNLIVIVQKLQHTPLQFLRSDLKKSRRRKAIRLPDWKFFHRFRLRIILQNAPNYVILFLGVFFVSVLLGFAVGMPDTLDYYQENASSMMLAKYQYVLKSYEDEDGNVIQTTVKEAEPFGVKSLQRKGDALDEEISVYGIIPDSRYAALEELQSLAEGEVYLSTSFGDKYHISVGDTVTLNERYEDRQYSFTVAGFYEKAVSLAVYMPLTQFRSTFDLKADEISGYFSDTELTDIAEDQIATIITEWDITKMTDQLDHSMGSYVQYFQVLCILLSAVLLYLLSKIIIEKNETAISMVKILGYENSEIASLYLRATTIILLMADALSVILGSLVVGKVWEKMMSRFSGWYTFRISPAGYVKTFLFILLGYLIVMFFDFRRIKKIPMDEALKNVE